MHIECLTTSAAVDVLHILLASHMRVTPQDSVESAGFSALVCAKSSHIILWSDLVHRNAV